MWSSKPIIDKYLYVRGNPYIVRIFGVIGIATTLLMAVGYSRFFGVNPFYAVVFGSIGIIFIFNKLLRYFNQLFYPKFDIRKHEKFVNHFWETHDEPSVDVFLPWAGEDLEMHEEVLIAVRDLDYKNYKVYMLDDNGAQGHKELSEKYGFVHLSRPNKGEHKKSGNLEYGYEHSNGKFVFILDADFIPSKNSLKDLIPYIVEDEKIGILQTPQYLEQHEGVHSRSKIEFGGGNIVEDFYKVSLPCRDVFQAAMCVGTSAIYRRDAILKLDGTPKVHASEDLATGLLITQHGYYVKYLPLIVSIGKSPETYQGYFKQHHRWCSGNLVFAYYWPRAKMSVMARLIYLANPTYYFSEAFSVIFSFHFLILLYFHTNSLSLNNTLYFLPYIIFSRVLTPASKSTKNRIGTKLAALSNSYTYIYTYLHMLFQGKPTWHPTGVKTSKLHTDFVNSINIGIIISSSFVILFLVVILLKPSILGNYNTYLILAWSFYSAAWHGTFLYLVSKYILHHKLTETNNYLYKVYLYLKTHFVMALTILLGVNIAISGFEALNNPKALTTQVLASITQKKPEEMQEKEALDIAQVEIPVVMAAQTSTEPNFIYVVISGDSVLKLALEAVSDYSEINNITISEKQINYAAAKMVKNSTLPETIYPDDEIVFDKEDIKRYVDEALRK